MGFASAYLAKQSQGKVLIKEPPLDDTGIIIIVPSYSEEAIVNLLDSLGACPGPPCAVEVIIGVNAPPGATIEELEQNRKTLEDIESWRAGSVKPSFRLFSVDLGQRKVRSWGAGLARKALMDEAISRFEATGNEDGVIVSLDADCTVSKNYLTEIYHTFRLRGEINGSSIRFEHQIPTAGSDRALKDAIVFYELHLRYYYHSLKYAGFPHVYYTVGSAMAVRASAYVKVAGMSRNQAGEDFYFIQKLVALGGYTEINNCMVMPSPRPSVRVPFGTGPAVRSLLDSPGSVFQTYNPSAFTDLRSFLSVIPELYSLDSSHLEKMAASLPTGIAGFLDQEEWISRVSEIKMNTAGAGSFVKRFFRWFNMFKVVKYLNSVHSGLYYSKIPVDKAALIMLEMIGEKYVGSTAYDLLIKYREIEK